jgi:hypothetical protein
VRTLCGGCEDAMISSNGITTPDSSGFSALDNADEIDALCWALARHDYLYIPAAKSAGLLGRGNENFADDWKAFADSWSRLQEDTYMADGGRYRSRRHATYSAPAGDVSWQREEHQPHYQSLHYNTLNGGIARHYSPIEPDVAEGRVADGLLTLGCALFGRLAPFSAWHIEAHQFRISPAEDREGKPTPEGIHRDGVQYVMMMLIERRNVTGGLSTLYDPELRPVKEITLSEPLEMIVVNDERIMHDVSPVIGAFQGGPAYRDVLVLTFRKKAS